MEPMGFESASRMETKEFCGAPWPSKVLKRKERNPYCPLIAPKASTMNFYWRRTAIQIRIFMHYAGNV